MEMHDATTHGTVLRWSRREPACSTMACGRRRSRPAIQQQHPQKGALRAPTNEKTRIKSSASRGLWRGVHSAEAGAAKTYLHGAPMKPMPTWLPRWFRGGVALTWMTQDGDADYGHHGV